MLRIRWSPIYAARDLSVVRSAHGASPVGRTIVAVGENHETYQEMWWPDDLQMGWTEEAAAVQ